MAEIVSPMITTPAGEQRPVTCTQCGNIRFERQVEKTESRWGFTQHKMTLFVCTHCQHVEQFYASRVIFMQAD